MKIPDNILKEHFEKAIHKITTEGIPKNAHSTTYDVVFKNKPYPPKLLISYANLFANGEELDRSKFKGGKGTPAFELLKKEGFQITQKANSVKSIIENYKTHIAKTQLKDEIYKWELINQYRGRPNPKAIDFYKEIKNVKFKNLIYAMGMAVIAHLAKEKAEELRLLFINLYDESKDLTERVKSFNNGTLKLYRELGETLQHHQDERSIATYLTFHNPDKYTLYKSSFYKKYCKLLNVEVAKKNEKYTHYLTLIDDLIKKYIEPDIELIEQVKELIPDFYDGTNHKLLAQDILYQMLDKKGNTGLENGVINMKDEFKQYLTKNNTKGSQKAPSYIRSLELLDTILYSKVKNKLEGFKSIYNITSSKIISNLHLFILEEQKKDKGIFENEEPISYWRDRFYSAAIKSYLDFLNLRKLSTNLENKENMNFSVSTFHQDCTTANLKYSNQLVTRYISSLVTKPFVLLSGLSGSGKTKLAQSFAQWICEADTQYCIVPVGADWTNREPLLGYVNALDNKEYILPENGALQLLIEANKGGNENKPYFLILDEMNLSHVERYFADFLSVMESKDKFKLHSSDSNLNITDGDKFEKTIEVPNTLDWPKNLFVVGTVNIDETTYMFSPKVLDRANAIEFRVTKTEIESFLNAPKEIDLEQLEFKGANIGADFVEMAKNKEFEAVDTKLLNKTLVHFFAELKKTGAEFGYRTGMEIHRLYNQLSTVNTDISENDKIDITVMQKLLPKLHGSRRKLCPILEVLATLCVKKTVDVKIAFLENKEDLIFKENDDVLYPLSLEKITRMYKGAIDNGFASYAEA